MPFLYPFSVDSTFVNDKERTFKLKFDICSSLFDTFAYFKSTLSCSGSHFPTVLIFQEYKPCHNNCPLLPIATFLWKKIEDAL